MNEPIERIAPREARSHLARDPDAYLVCAYDDMEKYRDNRLEGAISLDEFRKNSGSIPKDREIIFYCA